MPNPVVFLPGYYGTTLVDRVTSRIVWLTLDGIFHSGEVLDAIRLDTGDPNRIVSDGVLLEVEIVGRWSPNVYKALTIFLGSLGLDVTPFGVDWRRPLDFTIADLDAKIRGILSRTGAAQVDIIAHSHGGLVTRKYLDKFGGALVRKFITMGTPHKGMLETFKALCEGISFFGFSPSHVMKVARSFPSAYELLPFDAADGLFTFDNAAADPFSETRWVPNGVSKAMLADAAASSQALPRQIPVDTTMIFGTHLDTLGLAEASSGPKNKFRIRPNGDGTVPTVSASGNGITSSTKLARFAIPYGVHAHIFERPEAQRVIKNVLLDRPMPHFAWSFESAVYTPGAPFGVAADVRDENGDRITNAVVELELKGFKKITLPDDGNDFFARLQMPGVPRHLEYRLTVNGPSLAIEPQVGILFAANHF
jgi:pimeloyl-ACP methyl ester carboxylesterase